MELGNLSERAGAARCLLVHPAYGRELPGKVGTAARWLRKARGGRWGARGTPFCNLRALRPRTSRCTSCARVSCSVSAAASTPKGRCRGLVSARLQSPLQRGAPHEKSNGVGLLAGAVLDRTLRADEFSHSLFTLPLPLPSHSGEGSEPWPSP